MDSHLITANILNTNFQKHSDLKLDEQAIRLNDNDTQTIQNRRSSNSGTSGESDVDSGIVAIEHNLSKLPSDQLQIRNLNKYQESNQKQFNNVQISHFNYQQSNSQFQQKNSQINQLNQIDYQLNLQQIQQNNHLNSIKLETSDELDSERIRNSCKEVLAKLNLTKPIPNDAIYANLNSINSNSTLNTINSNSDLITINSNSTLNTVNSLDPNSKVLNTFGTLSRVGTFNRNHQKPSIGINSNSDSKLIPNLNQKLEFSCNQFDNQYAVPVLINCDCLNCEQNKKQKHQISSLSLNPQLVNNQFNQIDQQSNDKQITTLERRNNQEDIKRLLLEALRQKNLEKEQLEYREKQLQMYLQEREKIIKEKEIEKSIKEKEIEKSIDKFSKINLNDDLDANSNMNNLINKNVQYENISNNLETVNQQTYQNLPFHNLNKQNEFTKSCFIKRPNEDSNEDELITKSYNGGYCSKQTKEVLSFGNKKVDNRSFLQRFSFKFAKAFTRAFYSESTDTKEEIKNEKSISDQINKNEKIHSSIDLDNKKLIKENSINKIKQSNFIDKIKSIETVDTIDSNKINKDLREETKQDKQFKKKNFQINLDEYCIIKKPDELTPKKLSIDSIKDDDKRKTIKKRNSVIRKSIVKDSRVIEIPKVRTKDTTSRRALRPICDLKNVTAELIEINKDGTQVIELKRESIKHWGFYVARGKVKNVNGVYVTRMKDEPTKYLLRGLVEVGDQILSIDDINVIDLSILEVNHLMTNKKSIKLHVKPYTKS